MQIIGRVLDAPGNILGLADSVKGISLYEKKEKADSDRKTTTANS
jgi:hypothetical protein